MEEREINTRRERVEAWKKNMKEKLGRDHLSSIQGYVVAGCIFDILDEIWDKQELKIIQLLEEQQKNHYNVYVYGLLRYPPLHRDRETSWKL
jgi:hypothetical protein